VALRRLGLPIKDIDALVLARREEPARERRLLAATLLALQADLDRRARAVEAALDALRGDQVQAA
jgi:DNA-binding transcriptional MerR regulator